MNQPNQSDVVHLQEQLRTARNEINNLRQQIRSLKASNDKDYNDVLHKLNTWRCSNCIGQPEATAQTETTTGLQIQPIGVIRTTFAEKRGTPRQPTVSAESQARIELDSVLTNPEHSLEGLEDYSHFWILFHFDRNDSTHVRAKVAPPRLNGLRVGVFATRSPHRPNPIGLSLVRKLRIDGRVIYFHGVDMLDGTPVIDIKPYIPMYDMPGILADPGNRASLDGQESDESPVARNFGEREAPDGEEDDEAATASGGNVQVPNWIVDPPVASLTVEFSDEALVQLREIKKSEFNETKVVIGNVLSADPRSSYLRARWANQLYTFRVSDVNVTCKFEEATVCVVQIRPNCNNVE